MNIPADLATHTGYSKIFQPDQLTFGFILPLEGYPYSPWPTLEDHLSLARMADEAGFSAL